MAESRTPSVGIFQGRSYVGGAMRGYPAFNFPAFDRAAAYLRADGWEVVSPAELDRAEGFDEHRVTCVTKEFVQEAMRRDIAAIVHPLTTAMHLLPGWEDSRGVATELLVAHDVGLDVYVMDKDLRGYRLMEKVDV